MIGGFIGSPIGGVLSDRGAAAGVAALDFAATADGASLFAASGASVLGIAASGAGASINDAAGSALLGFIASGAGTMVLDGAGLAELDFAASGDGASFYDADGAAVIEIICSAGGAYRRIPVRVIVGRAEPRRSATAIGSKASNTRFGVPRSHTEITNG